MRIRSLKDFRNTAVEERRSVTIDLYPFHVLHPEVFSSCGDPRLVSQKKYLESRV